MFEYRISQHEFYRKGNSPKVFFCSGIHGDEHVIIPLLTEVLSTHENSLPDFLYIPYMSPSANTLKTRKNKHGHDLNRSFKNNYPPEGDAEIDTIVEILDNYMFDTVVEFHEDWTPEFYLYNSGGRTYEDKLKKYLSSLKGNSIPLLNGIDDPSDPNLSLTFLDGYNHMLCHHPEAKSGFLSDYLLLVSKQATSCMTLEIPTPATIEQKKFIFEEYIKQVILTTNPS